MDARFASKVSLIAALATIFLTAGCFTTHAGERKSELIITDDPIGKLGSASNNGFSGGSTNGFFVPLGTNSRTCLTCHVADDAYSISPATVKNIAKKNFRDPLFDPFDGGADCTPVDYLQPDARNASMLLRYALIREQIAIPSGADFSLVTATNPKHCQIPPGAAEISGKLLIFRRPLPTTNLLFLSDVRWDGRDTVQPMTTGQNFTSIDPLVFDLRTQGNKASVTHELSPSIVGTKELADIVDFERNLFTAQLSIKPLRDLGKRGGPDYLANEIARGFFIGQNDPLGKHFSSDVFTLFKAWEPDPEVRVKYAEANNPPNDLQRAIGEGEKTFNSRKFIIANVQGLNSRKNDPLFNPADPLSNKLIIGTCGTCHNTPNVGNHSTPLILNTGVASAVPLNNNGMPILGILDTENLPVYTLRSSTGSVINVTDPVRALISGRWLDVGKVRIPVLRGLAARPPYFHNGSAKDLATVISFYNARFNIGLTPEERRALMLFLSAL